MTTKVNNTKKRIQDTAWNLFYHYGYNNVTVDQIIAASQSSKGTFYHYFKSKDELVISWFENYDNFYWDWFQQNTEYVNHLDKLIDFSKFVFNFIELHTDVQMVSAFYSAQISFYGKISGKVSPRKFFYILDEIIKAGQNEGQIMTQFTYKDLSRMIMTVYRGILYDWCIAGGIFSLEEYGVRVMDQFLESFRTKPNN
ncbi:TetR/AcrR family transcriptional regulator [Alkaliphilus peptidifermentans]|uniref:Transcriptional regulator, TetR family n=1 Tax=Alkaliphilus peptidifermentans DSM 18978 TaxID=1120976 RepID=A0A1G5L0A6_9FIRM|nr:TetR/AcrR family transcriptional regulator [Alkaliphilus peptidifermentans]SCZ06302.1 transcriptional regulator, TetR family [Alkaliphilus peptidifermentans DSM 18978]